MTRNYRKEYDNYHSKLEQRKKRSSRNKANRIKGVKGKDVDHKDGNPMNNNKSNLAIRNRGNNRSFARTKTARKKNRSA